MNTTGGLLIFAVALGFLILISAAAYLISIYNSLVRLRRDVDKSWSNIDVLLKQRSDELPNLIDTVQEYVEYEEQVLKDITEARTRVEEASTPREEAEADLQVRSAIDNLLAVAEDYPELKASQNFQNLQQRISDLEDRIADRREFYNESVNTYNIRIHQIPYNLVADLLNYQSRELFEVASDDRKQVDVRAEFAG